MGNIYLYNAYIETDVKNMNKLQKLPPNFNFNTHKILKKTIEANKALAELKGYSDVIPNKNILINAVTINEAKDSSEIENIITTHDELYKAISSTKYTKSAKEVVNYRAAIWRGYELVKEKGFISTNIIIEVQSIIEQSKAGIRKIPGTVLKNEKTNEIVYTPPKNYNEIIELMNNLEEYINSDTNEIDDLVKMAIIHYQFESIHPFYDGNGRTGRILNILYLTMKGLLGSPILYISSYINKNKNEYYKYLQEIRNTSNWENWTLYILEGIRITSINTLKIMKDINKLIDEMIEEIKVKLPKLYSKELIDVIFYEFYTKISFVEKGIGVTRKTASNYLFKLENAGFLVSEKIGKERIYLNKKLFDLIKYASF